MQRGSYAVPWRRIPECDLCLLTLFNCVGVDFVFNIYAPVISCLYRCMYVSATPYFVN